MDFDLNGAGGDQIFVFDNNRPDEGWGPGWRKKTVEFNQVKNPPTDRKWFVRDNPTALGMWVWPSGDDGTSNSFSSKDVGGRRYQSGEDVGWAFGAWGHLGYDNGESIAEQDDILWYVSHMHHHAAEGGDQWHSAGPWMKLTSRGHRSRAAGPFQALRSALARQVGQHFQGRGRGALVDGEERIRERLGAAPERERAQAQQQRSRAARRSIRSGKTSSGTAPARQKLAFGSATALDASTPGSSASTSVASPRGTAGARPPPSLPGCAAAPRGSCRAGGRSGTDRGRTPRPAGSRRRRCACTGSTRPGTSTTVSSSLMRVGKSDRPACSNARSMSVGISPASSRARNTTSRASTSATRRHSALDSGVDADGHGVRLLRAIPGRARGRGPPRSRGPSPGRVRA